MSLSLDLDLSGVRVVRTDSLIECQDIDKAFHEAGAKLVLLADSTTCLLYTSPSPRDQRGSRMPSSA